MLQAELLMSLFFLTHRQFEVAWSLGGMEKIQLLGTSRVRLDKEKSSEKPPQTVTFILDQ